MTKSLYPCDQQPCFSLALVSELGQVLLFSSFRYGLWSILRAAEQEVYREMWGVLLVLFSWSPFHSSFAFYLQSDSYWRERILLNPTSFPLLSKIVLIQAVGYLTKHSCTPWTRSFQSPEALMFSSFFRFLSMQFRASFLYWFESLSHFLRVFWIFVISLT